jgi:hypothetical protein
MKKFLDLKLMLFGIAVILTASPLAERDSGLSMAAIIIGLFFVIIGLALNTVEMIEKQKQ